MPSVDQYASCNALLQRWALSVDVHRGRIAQVLALVDSAKGGGLKADVADAYRTPAISQANAEPPSAAELSELCIYFGIGVESDTAGGHAVLHEARRICEIMLRARNVSDCCCPIGVWYVTSWLFPCTCSESSGSSTWS